MIALKEPLWSRKGPREWTPRIAAAVKKVEFLGSLIPLGILEAFPEAESRWDSLTGKEMALMLQVRVRKWKKPWAPEQFQFIEDNVWITEDGVIITEAGIRDLLSGQVEGYEYLAGQWEKWILATEPKFSPELFPRT